MFKIGDFSRLAQVSIKALRYYDQIGLLKPAQIDRFTNFRYYSADQLAQLNRILALKDLGLSLESIADVLRDDLSPARLRELLAQQRAELQRQVAEKQARLARVEARLRQIAQEGALPPYEVVIKAVPAQRVAALRAVVASYADGGCLFTTLAAYLSEHSLTPAMTFPWLSLYHDEGYRESDIDTTAAAPLPPDHPLSGDGRITVSELPAVEMMASAIHRGPYEDIHLAYHALMQFMAVDGWTVNGPNRSLYLQGPGPDPALNITEIQFPVIRRGAGGPGHSR